MGSGGSHPARLACVDTGVLVSFHQHQHGKTGPGGAALLKHQNALYLAGNKGLAVFKVSPPGTASELERVQKLDTNAIAHDSGCDLLLRSFKDDSTKDVLYVGGGKGLAVYDVKDPLNPVKIGDGIETGALGHNGGCALAFAPEGADGEPIMYLAGPKGLCVLSLTDPLRPSVVGDVIDTGALGSFGGVALQLVGSDLLYVAGGNGVAVMDIAGELRKAPIRLGGVLDTHAISTHGCCSFAGPVAGKEPGDVLLISGGKGLSVIDMADPRNPQMTQGSPMSTGLVAWSSGCKLMIAASSVECTGPQTLLVAGGKGLGAFHLPLAEDLRSAKDLKKIGEGINTGALSHGNETAMLLDEDRLYVAGGNGMALFDAKALATSLEVTIAGDVAELEAARR